MRRQSEAEKRLRESIRLLRGARYWIRQMDRIDKEFVAAALLGTTQGALRFAGFRVVE